MTAKLRPPRSRPGSLTALPVASVQAPPADSEFDQQRTLLGIALLRVALATLALVALALLSWLSPARVVTIESWQYVVIGVTYALTIVYVVMLGRREWADRLAWAQIGLDGLTVSIVVLLSGGAESVFTFAYIFVVFSSSIALPRRGAFAAALIASALFGGVLLLQAQQILPVLSPLPFSSGLYSFLVHSTGMFLVAWLGSRLAESARLTVQRLAETAFDYEQLQELHAAILRSLPTGLMTVDPLGVVRYANDAAGVILARAPSHMLGQHLSGLVPNMERNWSEGRAGGFAGKPRWEDEHIRPNHSLIRLGYSFAPLESGEGACVVVFQDVTEVLRLEEAVERAQRLATVGQFAAGLAHEVRNPLASMCASIHVLEQSLEVPPPLQRLMNNVVSEAERLESLIRDFLAFARPRALSFGDVDVLQLARDVALVSANDPRMSNVDIRVEGDDESSVRADGDMLKQVVWNLVRNAADALGDQPGHVILRAERADNGVVLSVSDNGPGISTEQQSKIFDPFYTTKEGGSGLGLAITHAILEAHGAQLSVQSAPGEGTTMIIQFSDRVREAPSEVPSSEYGLEPRAELGQGTV